MHIWLILFIGLGLWFGRSGKPIGLSSIDKSAILQIATLGLSVSILLLFAIKHFRLHSFCAPITFLFFYGVCGIATAGFSPTPALSIFKASSIIIESLFGVIAISVLSDNRALVNIGYGYLCFLLLLTLSAALLFPQYTQMASKGVFGFMLVGWPHLNPNSLGALSAIVAVSSLIRTRSPSSVQVKFFHLSVFF